MEPIKKLKKGIISFDNKVTADKEVKEDNFNLEVFSIGNRIVIKIFENGYRIFIEKVKVDKGFVYFKIVLGIKMKEDNLNFLKDMKKMGKIAIKDSEEILKNLVFIDVVKNILDLDI